MSKLTLNIVEPASPTPINPVDPGTGTAVPDTGLFTHGIGGAEAAIIATVSLVVILAIIGAVIYHKKKAKQGSTTSLLTKCKKAVKNKKYAPGLAVLALLVSLGTLAGLVKLTAGAIEGEDSQSTDDSSALTVDVSSTEFTIELADKPVFAVLPVDITVEEATTLGYTLTAFAEDTNLVSTTDSSKVIPMVTVDTTDIEEANEAEEANEVAVDAVDSSESSDSSTLVPLSPNTYGLSLTDPDSITDEVYTSLSTDSTAPTFITDKDYLATAANDTTTIYYGFYITPDTPYGTYTGSNISVDAIPNMATVTYNANGLYFNDDEEYTENTVGYKPNIAEAPIEEVVGEYMTPAPLTPVDPSTTIHYTFLGWSETEGATTPTYTNEEDILANLTLAKNESLTLYAVWHYDTVLSFDGNTSDGGEAIEQQTIAAGTTITLPQNTYTRTGSVFTGWNTAADGSGEAYADEADFTAPLSSADITLYAQWAYTTIITFNGNGAASGSMSPQTVVAGTPQTLTPNAFTKSNATFVGWNTQANGSGTSYTDEAEFTASTSEHEDITLYAQWAYTTISFNGNTSDAGTMNSVTIAGGTTSNLPANTFIKNNCIFTGWNTDTSGTGISYGNSTPYTANATTTEAFTLYAQWQCVSQVNYLGNGATSGEMSSSIILGGSTLTFSQNTYAKDGYIFNGWNTEPNGTGTPYPDQGTFTAPMTPATTLNLYAQWIDCGPNKICYKPNGANSTPAMADQSVSSNTDVELWASNYKYDTNNDGHNDYGFAGWSEDKDAATKLVDNDPTNNPVVYGPNQTITTGDLSLEGMKLYAVWIAPEENTTFQTFTCPNNTDMSIGSLIALKDNRDNEVYTVAKLADGNCWMTENLRLDDNATINATNTNSPISSFTALSPSSNSWCGYASAPCINQSMLNTNNIASTVSEMTGTNANIYSYSNYYNWYSATAGNGTYNKSSGEVAGDICPAGWILPIGNKTAAKGSFSHLDASMGGTGGEQVSTEASNRWRSFPNNFVYSGSVDSRGDEGYYWSSTANGTGYAYSPGFNSNYVDPGTRGQNKSSGYSVRCVAPAE